MRDRQYSSRLLCITHNPISTSIHPHALYIPIHSHTLPIIHHNKKIHARQAIISGKNLILALRYYFIKKGHKPLRHNLPRCHALCPSLLPQPSGACPATPSAAVHAIHHPHGPILEEKPGLYAHSLTIMNKKFSKPHNPRQ